MGKRPLAGQGREGERRGEKGREGENGNGGNQQDIIKRGCSGQGAT